MKIAQDNLFFYLKPFEKVNKSNNPIRGYFASYFIAFGCCAIGELNFVAPLITIFYMMVYCLINLSCFFLAIQQSPGWRPSFRYFHWSFALLGALVCAAVIFTTGWIYSTCAFAIAIGLYKYIEVYGESKKNW